MSMMKRGYEHQYLVCSPAQVMNHENALRGGTNDGHLSDRMELGALFADYDSDGDKDLILANSYPET
jgi:hypothetical protein